MKESFLLRAKENLESAEILFKNEKFNASANRAYYAAFHLAFAALFSVGVKINIDHKIVQSQFVNYFFNRRKILPQTFKDYLLDMQDKRNDADYKNGVSKKKAQVQLKMSKIFFEIVYERIKL